MTRTGLAVTLVLALFFSATSGVQLSPTAKANIMIGIVPPVINIESPANRTYSTDNLTLRVTFGTVTTGLYDGGPRYENTRLFTYTLDGEKPNNIKITRFNVGINPGANVLFEGEAFMKELTEGLHNITVRVVFIYSDRFYFSEFDPSDPSLIHAESESRVFFRIDTAPQNISLLMAKNSTYLLGVPLQFSIDEPASWMGYSLDGQETVTINGNTTLPGVSVGQHNLTVYAKDSKGNPVASETIAFSMINPIPIVLIVAVSVAVVGALVYFKKRSRKAESQA